MIIYSTANTRSDLEGILTLQRANLAESLSVQELQSQGFVTVTHSFEMLKKLNDREKHIVAKKREKVIGYLLAMTLDSKSDIPVLLSMFDQFEKNLYKGRKISGYNFLVVGQVCIDKDYRGRGILDACYTAYKNYYHQKYDFAITVIAATNHRSINAHKRIGFTEVDSYTDPGNNRWIIVVWDWINDIL